MAGLTEVEAYETLIYLIEITDAVIGGANGIANLQAKQLANRTAWLKANKQDKDATLTALAALVTAADKMIYATGLDTFATTTLTAFARTLLDDVDAAAMRATLGAVSQSDINNAITTLVNASPAALDTLKELATALGNDANFATTMTNALAGKQPIDATLTALSALVTAADKMIYATAADTFSTTTLTAFARTLLDDVDGAAVFATLGSIQSLSSNGYIKLPNRFIIQWGITSTITGGTSLGVILPISFPNATLNVHASNLQNSDHPPSIKSVSNTGFTLSNISANVAYNTAISQSFYWFAFGY